MIPYFCNCSLLNYPLLIFSKMVRPAGHGRGANNPPPLDYMAGMMQQFEPNRHLMQGIMDQFQRPNVNRQPFPITLQDFVRLNPAVFRNSV
jgi:hypothetical protein